MSAGAVKAFLRERVEPMLQPVLAWAALSIAPAAGWWFGAWWLLAAFVVHLVVLHWLYAACMNYKRLLDRKQLPAPMAPFAWSAYLVGMFLDVSFNLVWIAWACLQVTRDWTFTSRMERYQDLGAGWRFRLAAWACPGLLDGLEEGGCHCKGGARRQLQG